MSALDFGLAPIYKKDNLFGDNISFVECYDFSKANLSDEHRLHAITSIASICYNNPKAINSQSLYDRLYRESKGLPSSSFEFIKMLIPVNVIVNKIIDNNKCLLENGNINKCLKEYEYSMLNIFKFGTILMVDGIEWVLTNYRAVVHDQAKYGVDLTDFYNNVYQCEIIKYFSYVFKIRMDTNTRTQFIRHRVAAYQEVSRRYVSGKRLSFSFYEKDNCKGIYSNFLLKDARTGHIQSIDISTEQVHEIALNHYFTLLDNKVLPQDARRVLPQSMYTDLWAAFDYESLHNFKELRSNEHAQWEIRVTSETMEEFVGEIKKSTNFKMKKEDNFIIDKYVVKEQNEK